MRKEIESTLAHIVSALTSKSDKELSCFVEKAIESINKSKLELDNPERFNSLISHKLKRIMSLLVNTLHKPSLCKNKDKPNFIYTNYEFLERNIRSLCILREGDSCCADKSRYIIKMFLQYTIDGKIPDFDPTIEKYYIPKFGDNEMWIRYCDSLYELYHGKTEEYFTSYNKLLQTEVRKYKHTLNTWFIKLKDGNSIGIGHTWDKNLNCPISEYDDLGDFYIINKRFIKDMNFETYIPEDEEDRFLYGDNYVKLPKASIEKIYYKSEDKMI